jgi:hypothetical protein
MTKRRRRRKAAVAVVPHADLKKPLVEPGTEEQDHELADVQCAFPGIKSRRALRKLAKSIARISAILQTRRPRRP